MKQLGRRVLTLGAAEHIGMRLRPIREALNQREFATRADLKPNRYSQYATGTRPLAVEAALDICDEYSLSVDWLYRADR
jgi:transcriptional regulator with XRE-family HTH domain